MTVALFLLNILTTCSPIPRLPPVTIITFPVKSIHSAISFSSHSFSQYCAHLIAVFCCLSLLYVYNISTYAHCQAYFAVLCMFYCKFLLLHHLLHLIFIIFAVFNTVFCVFCIYDYK